MFSRSDTKKRAKIATVSVGEKRTNVTLGPRSNLQSLQSPATFNLKKYTPEVQATSPKRMEHRDSSSLHVREASRRKLRPVQLT